jgi:hypothetical protein
MTMIIGGDESTKSMQNTTKKRVDNIVPGGRMILIIMISTMKLVIKRNKGKRTMITKYNHEFDCNKYL